MFNLALYFIDDLIFTEYRPNELNKKPEEVIGSVIKSTMTNLTKEDIANKIEKHMLNLRLLKKVNLNPNCWLRINFHHKGPSTYDVRFLGG